MSEVLPISFVLFKRFTMVVFTITYLGCSISRYSLQTVWQCTWPLLALAGGGYDSLLPFSLTNKAISQVIFSIAGIVITVTEAAMKTEYQLFLDLELAISVFFAIDYLVNFYSAEDRFFLYFRLFLNKKDLNTFFHGIRLSMYFLSFQSLQASL